MLFSVLFLVTGALLSFWRDEEREKRFAREIESAASRYDADPMLIKAVIWRESRFDPDVRGKHGEIGLMQLQELAAQEWADTEKIAGFEHEHCIDPKTNTLAGTFYLAKLLKRYTDTDDPIPYALADYNAGRGNVIKWNNGIAATNSAAFIEQIGFPSTQNYVKAVMKRHAMYRFIARFGFK